jgi:hypothetical protein
VKLVAALAALLVGFLGAALPASANDDGGITQYFNDVTVNPGEVVNGNVSVIFGSAHINGRVDGDVNVVGGSCDLGPGGTISGKRNCADGPLAMMAPFAVAQQDRTQAFGDGDLYLRLASGIATLVLFLLFPLRTRIALDRVERYPGLAGVAGFIGALAFFPLMLLLLITVVGIPLVPIVAAACLWAVWIGIGSVALIVGRRLSELVAPRSTPSPFAALLLGLVVVTAAEMLPKVGGIVTAIVYLVGFGATIVSFVSTDRLSRFPGASRRPMGV